MPNCGSLHASNGGFLLAQLTYTGPFPAVTTPDGAFLFTRGVPVDGIPDDLAASLVLQDFTSTPPMAAPAPAPVPAPVPDIPVVPPAPSFTAPPAVPPPTTTTDPTAPAAVLPPSTGVTS